ncbi:MAG: cyclic nucleotide-binding domain-containing protein [Myxococcales bacterium]|nr:cyclic nucleotide-binding domain-containing protein [Myxococcales bacterium]
MHVDLLIHAANATLLVSFLVRDILKLRMLSVVAGGMFLSVCLLASPVGWASLAWNLVFALINGVQITRLLLERRPVHLRPEEHELHRLAFRALRPREMLRLLGATRFVDAAPGEVLVAAGRDPERLLVVLEGRLEVRVAGASVAALGPGQFVGEMAFLTRELPKADVVVVEPARLASLDAAGLRRSVAHDAELRAAVQGILGADLAGKLRAPTGRA